MSFYIFIFILIVQRLAELLISKKNEKWLLEKGAVEYGHAHYPAIVTLHTLFILSLIAEYNAGGTKPFNIPLLFIFIALILFKVWTISSLGKFWNTKIFRIPGTEPIKKGPYKLIKHPNYVIVICEIAITPLIFNLYVTAVVFSVLNAIVLSIRIKEENKVWK